MSQYLVLLIQAMQATHGDPAALAKWADLARTQMQARAVEATAKKVAARAHISDNRRATAEAWSSAAHEQAKRWDEEKRRLAESRLPYIDRGVLKGYWVDLRPSMDGTKAILTLFDACGQEVSIACHVDLLSADLSDAQAGHGVTVSLRHWSDISNDLFTCVYSCARVDSDLTEMIKACLATR